MLHQNKLLPLLLEPWTTLQGTELGIRALPGSQGMPKARSGWTGASLKTLSDLVRQVSGIEGTPLGPIDFTGAWHDAEVLSVFAPGLTLAIDSLGRHWIAELREGNLGPIWCVFDEPQVAIYVGDSLEDFLRALRRHLHFGTFAEWMNRLDDASRLCWQHRGALAFRARGSSDDARVRRWLLSLPRDARVYDLRTPHFGCGFPYGAAGPSGELHRCGGLPLFAVSGFPAPARWSNYLGELATRTHIPRPGIARLEHHDLAPDRDLRGIGSTDPPYLARDPALEQSRSWRDDASSVDRARSALHSLAAVARRSAVGTLKRLIDDERWR